MRISTRDACSECGSAFVVPWVKEQETLVLEDKVAQGIAHLQSFLNIRPQLAAVLHCFQHKVARMHYGPYRQRTLSGRGRLRVRGNKLPPHGAKAPVCAGMSRILTPCSLYGVSFSSNRGNLTGMHALGWQPECQAIDMHPR